MFLCVNWLVETYKSRNQCIKKRINQEINQRRHKETYQPINTEIHVCVFMYLCMILCFYVFVEMCNYGKVL